MFTGLVSSVGSVRDVIDRDGVKRFRISTDFDTSAIDLGASIMHAGVCLTVVEAGHDAGGENWLEVEAVPETLARSTLGDWTIGSKMNMEQSLRVGDELGGHYVFGHVDGLGEVISILKEGASHRLRVRPPPDLVCYFATKGSVAVEGVSLTIAQTFENGDFEIAIIPHTWDVTTLRELQVGSKVNLEVDMLARYVARMIGSNLSGQKVAQ